MMPPPQSGFGMLCDVIRSLGCSGIKVHQSLYLPWTWRDISVTTSKIGVIVLRLSKGADPAPLAGGIMGGGCCGYCGYCLDQLCNAGKTRLADCWSLCTGWTKGRRTHTLCSPDLYHGWSCWPRSWLWPASGPESYYREGPVRRILIFFGSLDRTNLFHIVIERLFNWRVLFQKDNN